MRDPQPQVVLNDLANSTQLLFKKVVDDPSRVRAKARHGLALPQEIRGGRLDARGRERGRKSLGLGLLLQRLGPGPQAILG